MFQNIKELLENSATGTWRSYYLGWKTDLSVRTLRVFRHPYDIMRTGVVLELATSGDFASVRQRPEKTWRELVARKTPWKVTGEPKGKDPTIQASFFRGEPLNFGGVYTVQTLEDLYLKSIGSHGVPVGLSWNPCAISAWIYDSYCCWTVVCMLTFHLQNTIFLLMEWCSYLGFSEFQH